MIRRDGVMGCLVVMIAILGTVASGFALAVVEHTETDTEWSYVTEIAGLFEGSTDVPAFTDYSPSYNWTGWGVDSYDGGTYSGGALDADVSSSQPYSAVSAEIGDTVMVSEDSASYKYIYVANGSAVSLTAGTVDGAYWYATSITSPTRGLSIDDDGNVSGTLTSTGFVYITVTDETDYYIIALGIYSAVVSETAGITFVTQEDTNGYPVISSSTSETIDPDETGTIDLSVVTSSVEFESSSSGNAYTYGIIVNNSGSNDTLSTKSAEALIWLPSVVTVMDVIEYYELTGSYDTIRLYTGANVDSPIIARGWNGSTTTSDWIKTDHASIAYRTLKYYTLSVNTDDATMVSYIDVDLSTNVTTAYNVNGDYLWTSEADGVWIAWGGEIPIDPINGNYVSQSYLGIQTATSDFITIDDATITGKGYTDQEVVYMQIQYGVSIALTSSTEYVTWTNAQRNGAVDILFAITNTEQTYNRVIIPVYDLYGLPVSTDCQYALELIVSTIDGATTVSLSYGIWDGSDFTVVDSLASGVSIGTWTEFIVSLDTENGVFEIHPLISFTSFVDYEESAAAFTLNLDVSGLTFSRMLWFGTTEGRSATVGVVSTSVWLNTYNTVLLDPVLDIQDWFPDVDNLRINFYSFALYGDSITINGVTYEVSGSSIYIATEAGTVSEELVNFYIVYENGHTLITFVNSGTTYDLGVTVSYEISMEGTWYFAAALWEGEMVETTVTEWAAGEFYAFDWTESLVICCGLMLAGTAVGWRVNKGMKPLDVVIIVGAMAVVWIITGLEVFR